MNNKLKKLCTLFVAVGGLSLFSLAASAATITIINNDGAGEGFNDPTPVAAVPGNPATTLGGQRLNAAQAAADAWGAVLTSPITIKVRINFDPLTCNASSAILGQAGPWSGWRDFSGAPRAGTWYPDALADALGNSDFGSPDPDIAATFNSSIDFNDSCLFGTNWWYGIESPAVAGTIDFFKVLLHEMGHGLGFLTFVNTSTGAKALGFDDTYMVSLEDHSTGKNWPVMSDGERAASAIDTNDLHWTGTNAVNNNAGFLTAGVGASNHPQMYAPNPLQGGSSVSHWNTALTPNETMEPFATADALDLLTYQLFRDIGWTIQSSVTGTPCGHSPGSRDAMLRDTASESIGKCKHGQSFTPTASSVYSDVNIAAYNAEWITQLRGDGITKGCNAGNTLYCPKDPMTRTQAVKLVLRAEHGGTYNPPTTGPAPYTDVPLSHPDVHWIRQAKAEGITTGCDNGTNFCPDEVLTQRGLLKMLGGAY